MRLLGLPLDAWILLVFAVGLGLGLELAFILARRRDGAGGETAGSATGRGGAARGSPP